jgi:hypothetical protein
MLKETEGSREKTVISIDLDIKTLEWAELLGLDLSEMANQFLKIEVEKRLKEINDTKANANHPT